jgi:hypothetical protein
MVSSDPVHELGVQFAHKPQGKRQRLQALQAIFQRGYVISNLTEIIGAPSHGYSGFRGQQFTQGGLSTFNTTRKHSLTPDKGANEEIGVWQSLSFSSEFTQSRIGIRHRPNQAGGPVYGRRQQIGIESLVPAPGISPNAGRHLHGFPLPWHD